MKIRLIRTNATTAHLGAIQKINDIQFQDIYDVDDKKAKGLNLKFGAIPARDLKNTITNSQEVYFKGE